MFDIEIQSQLNKSDNQNALKSGTYMGEKFLGFIARRH
jgi:hypothetical protein